MKPKFVLPHDFMPTTAKPYENDGHPFTIWVRYEGPEQGKRDVYRWIFAIVVGEVIVRADEFYWHLPEEDMVDDFVVEYLFRSFRNEHCVKNPPTVLRIIPPETNTSDEEVFIFKAIGLVWRTFYKDKTSYPIEELSVDSYNSVMGNKRVLISSKSNPSMSYEVAYTGSLKKTYVTSYVEVDMYEFTDEELEN